jgi:hypothetical protein
VRDHRLEQGESLSRPARGSPQARPRAPASTSISLLNLQRLAGNAAIVDLLSKPGALTLQRDGGHGPSAAPAASATDLDERALAIINAAQADQPAAGERAIAVVRQILDTYYADRAATVRGITYDAADTGLTTTSGGRGATSTGSIAVGDYFRDNTTRAGFARRVLQVGHELEHIQQYRSGLGGGTHRHEREFLAFYHEGTGAAVAHTGRVSHSTRVSLLDEAIRHYNAFSDEDKRRYADQYTDLLAKRTEEQRASGHDTTDPPTEAAR